MQKRYIYISREYKNGILIGSWLLHSESLPIRRHSCIIRPSRSKCCWYWKCHWITYNEILCLERVKETRKQAVRIPSNLRLKVGTSWVQVRQPAPMLCFGGTYCSHLQSQRANHTRRATLDCLSLFTLKVEAVCSFQMSVNFWLYGVTSHKAEIFGMQSRSMDKRYWNVSDFYVFMCI
jgi:hypothetical protein